MSENPIKRKRDFVRASATHACSRRKFLTNSAAGAAGLALASYSARRAEAAPNSAWPEAGYIQINPNIDNLRVVQCTDAGMTTRSSYNNFGDANNNALNHQIIKASIDKMACALARKTNVQEAWAAIFRKPAGKSWAQTKMAMKVNANGTFNPAWSTVGRLCEALNTLGMPYANMTIFDGGAASGGGCPNKYGPFRDSGALPPVNLISRGDTYAVNIEGWATTCVTCVRDADILINNSVHKGHDRYDQFSGVTMALKNHVGTINFTHFGDSPGVYKLCGYHKHESILGWPGTDVPAKQQLCFVDSTFVGQPGDWVGNVQNGAVLNKLIMGTFPGSVDYLLTKKIRPLIYNDFNVARVNEFITSFGYSDAERIALDTMNPNTDPQGRGLADADNWLAVTSRGDVDAAIADHRDGAASQSEVESVIKDYRLGN